MNMSMQSQTNGDSDTYLINASKLARRVWVAKETSSTGRAGCNNIGATGSAAEREAEATTFGSSRVTLADADLPALALPAHTAEVGTDEPVINRLIINRHAKELRAARNKERKERQQHKLK